MNPSCHPGQRWVSVAEPELGLGQVRAVAARTVTLYFPATRETRVYVATGDAPLRRVAFRAGDTVTTTDGRDGCVRTVIERDGLLHYDCGDRVVCETELNHALGFSGPLDRLFAGQFDPSHVFDLRAAALTHQFNRRRSPVRGFTGGRIALLPHQLGIAADVTGRLVPRVLLADEVGLGKTIEACLILHRLLLTGRARRVLIVVPETLVYQWFLELLRRFNLWFHIFTEARCVAIEEANPGANPFLDDQLLLCDLHLFTDSAARVEQALAAGWDLVVVDEAHHLTWSPHGASLEYQTIERLGRQSPGLLLLTATPEQLGVAGHFARLRLLDPDRFHSLDDFVRESASYAAVAAEAQHLREAGRNSEVDRLLDQHGPGRVMFRNTRAVIAGFPVRVAHLYPLTATSAARRRALHDEWSADTGDESRAAWSATFTHDPRIDWIVSLLQSLAPQKVLLICGSQEKATAIESALRRRTSVPSAVFHEGLTLVQRDRGAASFADPDGVRLLICSEIGSEGRNFQFAHHLVLFDLPLDAGLLEQRIGRLDRIGQRETIHLHVPLMEGTHLEVLARWYHEGLNAFEEHVPGALELQSRFELPLRAFASDPTRNGSRRPEEFEAFIASVREARHEVARRMEAGRDRLLEWSSFKPELAARVVDAVRAQDEDRTLDEFMLAAFDLFAVQVEELAPRTFRLGSAGVLVDDFPGLKAEGLTFTRDRQRALVREDLQFLTWDHPLATGALDVLLGSERGNCGFARWPDQSVSALYLEAIYVLECLAPAALHADRFLPPTPIRVAVDHGGRDAADTLTMSAIAATRAPDTGAAARGRALLSRADVRETLLPRLLEATRQLADRQVPVLVQHARDDLHAQLGREALRLRELQQMNPMVRDEEIALLVEQERELDRLLAAARVRLDAVRLVYRGR